MEIWKDVKGYEGVYQISNFGNVKSLERQKKTRWEKVITKKESVLKPGINSGGYQLIVFSVGGKKKSYMIHRLVAVAFCENPNSKLEVNHKDGDKTNNHFDNLEWCSSSENSCHAIRTGLQKSVSNKKIDQFDKVGNYIKTFDSLTIAAKEVGISLKTISGNLRGKPKTAGGFVWKYSSEKNKP